MFVVCFFLFHSFGWLSFVFQFFFFFLFSCVKFSSFWLWLFSSFFLCTLKRRTNTCTTEIKPYVAMPTSDIPLVKTCCFDTPTHKIYIREPFTYTFAHTHTRRSGNDSLLLFYLFLPHFCSSMNSSRFVVHTFFCRRFLVCCCCLFLARFWLIRYCSCLRVLLSVCFSLHFFFCILVGFNSSVLLLYIPSIQVYLWTKYIERIPLQYLYHVAVVGFDVFRCFLFFCFSCFHSYLIRSSFSSRLFSSLTVNCL